MGTCLPAPSPHQNVVSELDGRGGECAPQGFLRARPQTCVSLPRWFPFPMVFLSMLFFLVPSALFQGLLMSGGFYLFCFKNKLKTANLFPTL